MAAPPAPLRYLEELAELLVDVSAHGAPAIVAVERVAESWRVHHAQTQTDTALLDVHRLLSDCGRSVYSLWRTTQKWKIKLKYLNT